MLLRLAFTTVSIAILSGPAAAADTPSLGELRARTRDLLGEAPPMPATDPRQYWLDAAGELHRRGDHPQAEAHLQQLLPRYRRDPAVMDLYLRVLLARGRSQEAADWILSQQNPGAQTPYTRFNLAVALARSGRAKEAITVLHRLGTLDAVEPELRALRDQANTALGWYFLGRNLGDNARASFRRVQLQGPHASRALLGMGWSELAPQDARAYRELVGDEASAFDPRQFSPQLSGDPAARRAPGTDLSYLIEPAGLPGYGNGDLSAEEEQALRRALRFWSELRERDRSDPFVWESWIAMPYALETAGLHEQAVAHYRDAIARMDALEAAMRLDDGRVREFADRVLEGGAGRSDASTDAWMGRWLAGQPARVVLDDIAEARRSAARLAGPGALERELRRAWALYEEDRVQAFRRLLLNELALRRELLRRYRQSAHIALARLLDAPATGRAPGAEVPEKQPKSFWERLNLFGKDQLQ